MATGTAVSSGLWANLGKLTDILADKHVHQDQDQAAVADEKIVRRLRGLRGRAMQILLCSHRQHQEKQCDQHGQKDQNPHVDLSCADQLRAQALDLRLRHGSGDVRVAIELEGLANHLSVEHLGSNHENDLRPVVRLLLLLRQDRGPDENVQTLSWRDHFPFRRVLTPLSNSSEVAPAVVPQVGPFLAGDIQETPVIAAYPHFTFKELTHMHGEQTQPSQASDKVPTTTLARQMREAVYPVAESKLFSLTPGTGLRFLCYTNPKVNQPSRRITPIPDLDLLSTSEGRDLRLPLPVNAVKPDRDDEGYESPKELTSLEKEGLLDIWEEIRLNPERSASSRRSWEHIGRSGSAPEEKPYLTEIGAEGVNAAWVGKYLQ